MLAQAVQRQHERCVADTLQVNGSRAEVKHLRTLRNAKGKRALTQWEAYVCYAAGSGGLACNDRWAQMGCSVEPVCPLCGMRDSLMHRVWFCAHPDVVQARNDLVDAEMLVKARAEVLDPFWTTGIFLHPI